MDTIKKGDLVYWCFFYAHNLDRFCMESGIVTEISEGGHGKLWLHGEKGQLLCSLDNASLTEKGALEKLKIKIQDDQDRYKARFDKETKELYEGIDNLRYKWLKEDSELNKKVGLLISKIGLNNG